MAIPASSDWVNLMAAHDGVRAGERLNVAVSDAFEPLKAQWLALEKAGHATPYQSYRFAESYFRLVEAGQGARPALITLSDSTGMPIMLLPLSVQRSFGAKIARFIGGKQANFNMPLLAPGAQRITTEQLRSALIEAGQRAGIDCFCLHSQPVEWEGMANPLAGLASLPSPSHGYKLALEPDSDALFKRRFSKDTRRKLRQKEQRIEKLGALAYSRSADLAEAEPALERFFALKAERFASQGIENPFAAADIRAFLREGLQPDSHGQPLIEMHRLTLDGRPVAMFGAVANANRFSGLITAFDGDAEIARSSPGDILLVRMIADCCARGLATFDLGVGEAQYKDKTCDAVEHLVETALPVTMKGKAAALACHGKLRLKTAIKTSAWGKRSMAFVRAMKARNRD